ncbi:S-layer homology domain-containing protein [Paenibacillus assamensis]|uniref:S-layer homology domain-containing protein n=1 Tax=Paenibacillus assamensis TaxID=311244 RepID=UPI00146E86DF|nr:S-layer homology domain-containing protein [Paenibacillus assamensis]
MKKRLAMLLSVAMAFSMFANVAFGAEAQLTTKEKFEALVKDGIFAGVKDKDGNIDPKLNEHTDRAQFAKILALTAGLSKEEGNSFKDKGYSTSWAKGYIEAVTKAGFMSGVGQDKFDLKGKVTGEQMAKAFTLALGLKKVEDAPAVEGVSKWAYGYVAAIKAAGFDFSVNGKWNVAVQRSVLVEAAYDVKQKTSVKVDSVKVIDEKTIEVKFTDGETVKHTLDTALVEGKETTVEVTHKGAKHQVKVTLQALAIEAKTVGAKTFEVKLNRTVDTAKAKFEVKRGSTAIDVKTATYSEDKLTYRVEASNKLSEGEYTINLVVGDKTVSAKAKVEAEKVVDIEIVGDKAATNNDYTELKIGYKVLNQYGEDASKIANLNWTISKGSLKQAKDGLLTVAAPTDNKFMYNEPIVIMVYDNNAGIVENKTVNVGFPARASEVEFKEIYNIDGATEITSTTDFEKNEFYLLIDVKDQYGNRIEKKDVADNLLVVSSNPMLLDVHNKAVIDTGKNGDSFAIKFKNPGSSMFRTTGDVEIKVTAFGSGKQFSHKVSVGQGTELKSFKLLQPEAEVAAGDGTAKIPFEAYDAKGNKVTKFADLNKYVKTDKTLQLSSNLELKEDKKTREGYFEFAVPTAEGRVALYATQVNNTAGTSSITIDVKKAAHADAVKGFDKEFNTAYGTNATFTIKPGSIDVIDQYSREIKADKLADDVYIAIENYAALDKGNQLDKGTVTGTTYEVDGKLFFNGKSNAEIKFTTVNKGDARFELALYKKDDKGVFTIIPDSQTTAAVSVVDKGNISSYEVKAVGSLFAGDTNIFGVTGATYSKDLEVIGKRANGTKVVLSPSDYVVVADSNYITVENGKTLKANKVNLKDNESVDVKLQVLVKGNEVNSVPLEQTITVSNKAQTVKKIETDKDAVKGNVKKVDGQLIEVKAGFTFNEILSVLKAEDQYGLKGHLNTVPATAIVINKVEAADKTVKFNGEGTSNVTLATGSLAKGDYIYATVAVHGERIDLVISVVE